MPLNLVELEPGRTPLREALTQEGCAVDFVLEMPLGEFPVQLERRHWSMSWFDESRNAAEVRTAGTLTRTVLTAYVPKPSTALPPSNF